MKISISGVDSDNPVIFINDTFPITDCVSIYSDEPDPLHRICYSVKKALIKETGRGVAYIINRQIDENGNSSTILSFVYSNSIGKVTRHSRFWLKDLEDDADINEAIYWKNEMALRCFIAIWTYMIYDGLTTDNPTI